MLDFSTRKSRRRSTSVQEKNKEFTQKATFKLGKNKEFTINLYGKKNKNIFNRMSENAFKGAFREILLTVEEKFEEITIKNRPATFNLFISKNYNDDKQFINQSKKSVKENYNMHVNTYYHQESEQPDRIKAVFAQALICHWADQKNFENPILDTIMDGIANYIYDLSKSKDYKPIMIDDKIVKEIKGKGFAEIIKDTDLVKKHPSIKSALIYFIDENSPDLNLIKKWSNLINQNTSLKELEKVFNQDIEDLSQKLKKNNESHIFDKFIEREESKAEFVSSDYGLQIYTEPDPSTFHFEKPKKSDIKEPIHQKTEEIIPPQVSLPTQQENTFYLKKTFSFDLKDGKKIDVNLHTKNHFNDTFLSQENISDALKKVVETFVKLNLRPDLDATFNLFISQDVSDLQKSIGSNENDSDSHVYDMRVNARSGTSQSDTDNSLLRPIDMNAITKVFAQSLASHVTKNKNLQNTILGAFGDYIYDLSKIKKEGTPFILKETNDYQWMQKIKNFEYNKLINFMKKDSLLQKVMLALLDQKSRRTAINFWVEEINKNNHSPNEFLEARMNKIRDKIGAERLREYLIEFVEKYTYEEFTNQRFYSPINGIRYGDLRNQDPPQSAYSYEHKTPASFFRSSKSMRSPSDTENISLIRDASGSFVSQERGIYTNHSPVQNGSKNSAIVFPNN